MVRGTPESGSNPAGGHRRRIGLVAHDHLKLELLMWARQHRAELVGHDLLATGTTGEMLAVQLGLDVTCFRSGPLGGDLQLGAEIADGALDVLVFFWDPLEPQPHDADVRALLRLATVWNIPTACNVSTADYLISSPLLASGYEPRTPQHERPDRAPARRSSVDEHGAWSPWSTGSQRRPFAATALGTDAGGVLHSVGRR